MINVICWGVPAAILGLAWFNSESKLKRYSARIFIAFVALMFICNLTAALTSCITVTRKNVQLPTEIVEVVEATKRATATEIVEVVEATKRATATAIATATKTTPSLLDGSASFRARAMNLRGYSFKWDAGELWESGEVLGYYHIAPGVMFRIEPVGNHEDGQIKFVGAIIDIRDGTYHEHQIEALELFLEDLGFKWAFVDGLYHWMAETAGAHGSIRIDGFYVDSSVQDGLWVIDISGGDGRP